ncbi:hypothetical protein FQR65_LT16038 [Abscondita terminalis]|nr:hypothetical protein FQR65_LT16038 [Abscondita terminalis]
MDKKKYITIFERFLSNAATSKERRLLEDFILHDSALSKWMEEEVSNSDSTIPDRSQSGCHRIKRKELNPIRGEAYFLRAFSYFQLVRWFGEIPALSEKNQDNAFFEEQSPIAQIYDFIIEDLKTAESTLPEKQEDRSKPDRYAAKALLAKDLDHIWHRAIRPWDHSEGGWGDWQSDKRFLNQYPKGSGNRLNGSFYLTMIDGTPWENTDYAQPYVGKYRDAGPKSGGVAQQANEVKGRIVNNTNEGIPDASIQIQNSTIGTNLIENGEFKISGLADGQHVLLISAVGFKKTSVKINTASIPATLRIPLEKDLNQLSEVNINGRLRFDTLGTARRLHDQYRSAMGQLEVGVADKKWVDVAVVGITYNDVYKQQQTGATQEKVIGLVDNKSHSITPSIRYRKNRLFIDNPFCDLVLNINISKGVITDTSSYAPFFWDGKAREYRPNAGEFNSTKSISHDKSYNTLTQANLNYAAVKHHVFNLNYNLNVNQRERFNEIDPYNQYYNKTNKIARHILGLNYQQNLFGDKWAKVPAKGSNFNGIWTLHLLIPYSGGFGIKVSLMNMLQIATFTELYGNGLGIEGIQLKPANSEQLQYHFFYNTAFGDPQSIFRCFSILQKCKGLHYFPAV